MITKFESNEISTSFESHPHKENANTYDYSNTKPTKWLRYFTLLFILYLPFLLLLVWEGVTYYYIKRSLHEVNEKIHKHRKDLQGWKYKIYQEDGQIEKQRARNWSQIGINLIGSGRGIIQTTVKDKALYSWNVSYSIGDISFKWRYVKIHVPGIYQITAQVKQILTSSSVNLEPRVCCAVIRISKRKETLGSRLFFCNTVLSVISLDFMLTKFQIYKRHKYVVEQTS